MDNLRHPRISLKVVDCCRIVSRILGTSVYMYCQTAWIDNTTCRLKGILGNEPLHGWAVVATPVGVNAGAIIFPSSVLGDVGARAAGTRRIAKRIVAVLGGDIT